MNVLITGASGFLGSNLITYFENREDINLFLSTRNKNLIEAISNRGVTSVDDISTESIDRFGIEAIIHLAGIAHDLSGKYDRDDYFLVNYQNTITLFNCFLSSKCTRFIFISSIKAVVDKSESVIREDFAPTPTTYYGESKLKAEQYLLSKITTDKELYILRPGMIHGKGNKGNLNVLYKFIKSGIPYPLGAFQNQRSFLSIDNFCFVVDRILSGKVNAGVYHLSDSGSISTRKLVEVIAESLQRKPLILSIPKQIVKTVFFSNRNILDKLTENMVIDNSKIVAQVGKFPMGLEEGLRKTIRGFDNAH